MLTKSAGQAFFAAMMIALGIMGLYSGNFAPIWQPVPKGLPAQVVLAYLCGCISLVGGAALLWRRTSIVAARTLLLYLLLWLLLFRLVKLLAAPLSQDPWSGAGETLVLVAAAWALCGRGLRIAQVLYGLALIPFGTGHFVFAKETAALVPGWLPLHFFFACFTGIAYIAAGIAMVAGICGRLAAVLSAWQIGLFTLLVWVPIITRGGSSAFEWSETIISLTLTASAWVMAESYRGQALNGLKL